MTEQRALGFDAAAWMQAALSHLAARLHHEVALTRVLRGPDRQEGFLGLFLDGGEAERVLAELAGRLRAEAVPDAARLDAEADALAARRGGFWRELATACHLGEAELYLLLLAAAPALDPRYGRVYAMAAHRHGEVLVAACGRSPQCGRQQDQVPLISGSALSAQGQVGQVSRGVAAMAVPDPAPIIVPSFQDIDHQA